MQKLLSLAMSFQILPAQGVPKFKNFVYFTKLTARENTQLHTTNSQK